MTRFFQPLVWGLVSLLWTATATEMLAQGTRLLREPSVSDDHIVFVHADDLWITGRQGSEARRLTSHEGSETRPHFSPDGSSIAFTAEYDGNSDVYVINATGGEATRLTWHPGSDNVTGWTPDGEHVLFTSGREGHPTAEAKFYKVRTDGGLPEALPIPRAATGEISDDGAYIAYQPVSFWDPEWRNYRGGQAKPIWVVNLQTYELETTPRTDNERHTDPVWLDGKVYYLSERDFANNIWEYDPESKENEQVTFHSQFDVKHLDAGGGMIVYEQGGYLYELDPATGEHEQIEIHVRGDMTWARPRYADVAATQLNNASLSPTGRRALFEHRGEIITVPKEHGSWRNLTKTTGIADRYPVWSPDGQQVAWFSDTSGEYQLCISDQEGLEDPRCIDLPEPSFFFTPAWSPDGEHIAYTDTHYRLWYVNVESGEAVHADTDGYAHPQRSMNPAWSPDSRWIAYAKRLKSHFRVINVHNIETGETLQLTDGMADAIDPVWDENGNRIYFLASTDFGLNTGWLDMSSYDRPITRGLYAVLLNDDTPSPFLPRSDEEPDNGKGEDENDKQNGNGVEIPDIEIDQEGIYDRIVAFDIEEKDYTGLLAAPGGYVFYMENLPDRPGVTLHRYNIDERKTEAYLSPVNEAVTSHDRKSLLYRSGNTWGIVETTAGPQEPGNGSLKTGDIRVRVEPKKEYEQIFTEGWRFQRDFLYVDNVHGAPWDKIYEWYRPWVDHVHHRSDMNYLIDILGGEVSVGHSYTFGGDFPDLDRVSTGLLGADLEVENGYYKIAKIYDGEDWNPGLDAPLAQPGIEVSEGDYLLAVNGEELRTPDNPFSVLEETAGQNTILTVNDTPSKEGARNINVVPVTSEGQLRLRDWVESNRRKVDEMSDGRLAYVWLPSTGRNGYSYFNRYYFAQQHKRGAVIDERNNGGGSAADYMIDVLNRKLIGYFNSKAGDRHPFTTPMAGLWGPKVMVINERAGSGGDLLPYMFRHKEIGPLIGTRTWGGLVGTWDTPPFIDGGRMIAPRGGFFNLDGEWDVEGIGVAPDIEVMQDPKSVIEGRDPQLERAVEEALKLLKTEGVELKQVPAPPEIWRRPEKTEGWN